MERVARVVAVLAVLSLLVPIAGPTGAARAAGDPEAEDHWTGELQTEQRIGLAGAVDGAGADGLFVTWGSPGAVAVAADRITIWTEMARGERVLLPGGTQTWYQTNHTHTNQTFDNVRASIKAWGEAGQVLVEPTPTFSPGAQASEGTEGFDASEASEPSEGTERSEGPERDPAGEQATVSVSGLARGPSSMERVTGGALAWTGVGEHGTSVDEGALPSYSYTLSEPMVRIDGVDRARAAGNFTSFVNNVTIQIGTEDGEQWSTWAGFRASPPAQAPGEEGVPNTVERYQIRIVRMAFENATLAVDEEDAISLLGSRLQVETVGTIVLPDVYGRISAVDRELVFDRDSAVLIGEADLVAHAGASSAPRLSVAIDGELEVAEAWGAESLAVASLASEGLAPSGWTLVVLVVGLVLGLAGLGVAVRSVRPWWWSWWWSWSLAWRARLLRVLPRRWRSVLYERWAERGANLEVDGRLGPASRVYQGLVALDADRLLGWYMLARVQLELGEREAVLGTVDRARERFDELPLDFLELRLAAFVELGADEEIAPALDEIASRGLDVARSLVRDLELQDFAESDSRTWWTHRISRGQGLDGYT